MLVACLMQPLRWCGGAGPPVDGGPLMRTPPTVCALPPDETGRPSSEPAEAGVPEAADGRGATPEPAGPRAPPESGEAGPPLPPGPFPPPSTFPPEVAPPPAAVSPPPHNTAPP